MEHTDTDYLAIVRDEARKLALVDADGNLVALDSLSVIDLLSALEAATGLSVPLDEVSVEAFSSLHSAADMLQRVASRSGR